jgi:hypothetical protein
VATNWQSLPIYVWICAWKMRALFNSSEFQVRIARARPGERYPTTQRIKLRCGRNSRSQRVDYFDQDNHLIAQTHHYVRRDGRNCTEPDPKWMWVDRVAWNTKHDDDSDECEDCPPERRH